jgi:ribose 5-phosphate isomerase B
MRTSGQAGAKGGKEMQLAIDSDRNGTVLRKALYDFLREQHVDVVDLDYLSAHEVEDYPDVAYDMAVRISKGEFQRGILICGTGLGMAICANKVQGVYAGVCTDAYEAERLIRSNNAQIITFGSQVTGVESAKTILKSWLTSTFEGGRSLSKVERLKELERRIYGDPHSK